MEKLIEAIELLNKNYKELERLLELLNNSLNETRILKKE